MNGTGPSSLNAFRWIEQHEGVVSLEKTERGRFRLCIPDPTGQNPTGVVFERATLLGVLYKAMEFEDRMRLLTDNAASELAVQTQRNEDRDRFRKQAGQHIAEAFGVKVKEVR